MSRKPLPHIQRQSPHPRSKTAALVLTLVTALTVPAIALSTQESGSSLAEATAIAERLTQQQQDPVAAMLLAVETARSRALGLPHSTQPIDESDPGAERASAYEGYAEALFALARFPDSRTLPAIESAVFHEDARVRLAAMTALREGASAHRAASGALLAARAAITGDPDPAVRRQAFEAYSRWGDQNDVLYLAQSLGRTPGPVRDLAVREWIRIEKERSQR